MNHLPKIVIDVIPHKKQRYDTCGDYFNKKGTIHINISQMNSDYEFLVLLHELIEWYLITQADISIEEIDRFDMSFKGKEPGDSPKAPYHHEHTVATLFERAFASVRNIKWLTYEKHINRL